MIIRERDIVPGKKSADFLDNYSGRQVVIRQGSGSESTDYYTGRVTDISHPLNGEKSPPSIHLDSGRTVPFNIDITSIDFLD